MPARPAAARTNQTTFGAPTVAFCGGAVVRLLETRNMWFEGRGSDAHEWAFFHCAQIHLFQVNYRVLGRDRSFAEGVV